MAENNSAEENDGTVLLKDIGNDVDNGTTLLSQTEDEEGTTILSEIEETTLLDIKDTKGTGNKLCNVLKEMVVTESEDYLRI